MPVSGRREHRAAADERQRGCELAGAPDRRQQQRVAAERALPRQHESRVQERRCAGALGQALPLADEPIPRLADILDPSDETLAIFDPSDETLADLLDLAGDISIGHAPIIP
jgi:hypothetical protein